MSVRDVYTETEGFPGLLNDLFGASTIADELNQKEIADGIADLLDQVERAFCVADREAYRDWAAAISVENGDTWEPCAGWYEHRCEDGCLPDDDADEDVDWEPCAECAWIDDKNYDNPYRQ